MDSTPLSLLQRIRSTDNQRAWDQFVDLYCGLLLRWARGLGLQEADAADLVQDVFATLVRVLPTFEHNGRTSFRAWLRTIVHNRWRDWCRRRVAAPRQVDDAALAALADRADAQALEENAYRQELVQRTLEIIEKEFRPGTWKAFVEHGLRGRSANEVADELRLTPGAVYAARVRVMARLRHELHGMLD